jgi:hypothetical protein
MAFWRCLEVLRLAKIEIWKKNDIPSSSNSLSLITPTRWEKKTMIPSDYNSFYDRRRIVANFCLLIILTDGAITIRYNEIPF